MVEAPALTTPVGESFPKQTASLLHGQEVLLIGCLFVGVARRDHEGIDFQFVVEKVQHAADGFGGVGVEESAVGGDAKALLLGFSDGLDHLVEDAFPGHG